MLSRADLLIIKLLALMSLLALPTSTAYASTGDLTLLRIGLIRHLKSVKQVAVSTTSQLTINDTQSGKTVASGSRFTIAAGDTSLVFGGDELPSSVSVSTDNPAALISIECPGQKARSYRGKLQVSFAKGALRIVNVIGLEDYLLGVLPAEMPSSYPEEALKAQAIAARTYALANLGKRASLGYDLCDTSSCQVYEGASVETRACTRAVHATAGVVLTYDGRPASIQYCADCGGATRCYADARPGSSIPYLCSVREPPEIAHSTWKVSYTVQELGRKLISAGVKEADGLKTLIVDKVDSSGRAQTVRLAGKSSSALIAGDKLRAALGSDVRSTLFELDSSVEGVITIRGRGHGHGIGMCQVGAKALAAAPFGYTCDRVLAHYFPGTTLSPTTSSAQIAAAASVGPELVDASTAPKVVKVESQVTAARPKDVPPTLKDANGPDIGLDVRVKAPRL